MVKRSPDPRAGLKGGKGKGGEKKGREGEEEPEGWKRCNGALKRGREGKEKRMEGQKEMEGCCPVSFNC